MTGAGHDAHVGGLLTVGACVVLFGGRLLPGKLLQRSRGQLTVDDPR